MPGRKGYSFTNHTADVELVARGKTLEEAFRNAALAMFDTSADIAALTRLKGGAKRLNIRERASTLEDLLWAMLQGALSIADAKGVYCYKVDRMLIKESKGGYTIDAQFSARGEKPEYSIIYVKGVSRFDMRVGKTKNGFTARAVLDV